MSVSASRLALLSVLLGLPIASATPAEAVGQEAERGETANVVVQNRASSHARVYVLQNGHMVPLGLVAGAASATLPLPPIFLQSGEPIELLSDPIGSTAWYKSAPLNVGPTSQVDFTIESEVERSRVAVRR